MTRFTVYTDHSAKTWDLYVNGTQVATALGFYSTGGSADEYSEVGILYGDATTPAVVDDVNIGTRNALVHHCDVDANWKVGSGEITSVLSYFRTAAGYHVNTSSADGYAPGAGLQVGLPHSADVDGNWKIDAGEITSVLSYFRTAAGYHINTSSADGFAPGAP